MSIKCILTEQGGKSNSGITVSSIEIKTPPNKTSYYSGETFNKAGMTVEGAFAIEEIPFKTIDVTSKIVVTPEILTDGITEVTISYTDGNGTTVSAKQPVTVSRSLKSIQITQWPLITTYEYGDTLIQNGLNVTATYSDGVTVVITPDTISPTTFNMVGTQTVTVTYKDESVASPMSDTFDVIVQRKKIAIPVWQGNFIYNGASQNANITSLWSNYDSTKMAMSGATSGVNAGSYNAVFTLDNNYRWSDESIEPRTIPWTIGKKTYNLTVSPSSVSLNASNYVSGVTVNVTKEGNGAVLASIENNSTAIAATVSGNAITITGDGTTPGTFNVIVSVGNDNNYVTPASVTISVTTFYFFLPFEEDAIGDEVFWNELKAALANSTLEERQSCLGRKVRVTLSSPVLGTTSHFVRCIGYDCDGAKTLTFQTMNCLAQNLKFTTEIDFSTFGNQALWTNGTTDSTARTLCKSYYNAFPGKNAIRLVKKRYCSIQDNDAYVHDFNSTEQYDETVFIPSENEMGWTQEDVKYNSTNGFATGKNEFAVENTTKTAYQYYTDNNKRVKYLGTDNDPEGKTYGKEYWNRSRAYYLPYSGSICIITRSGEPNYTNYKSDSGLAPAFSIG